MINLEIAEKLKKAGLQWEPKRGNTVYHELTDCGGIVLYSVAKTDDGNYHFTVHRDSGGFHSSYASHCIWLPRLDQLLTEIERRGYWPGLEKVMGVGYVVKLWVIPDKPIQDIDNITQMEFITPKSWEDATARALLWILGEKGGALDE